MGVFNKGNKCHVDALLEDLFKKISKLLGCNAGGELHGAGRLRRVEKERRESPDPVLECDRVFSGSGFRVDIDPDHVLQRIPNQG